jgi:hypothetical protein
VDVVRGGFEAVSVPGTLTFANVFVPVKVLFMVRMEVPPDNEVAM